MGSPSVRALTRPTLGEVRAAVLAYAVTRGLFRLCQDAPPRDAVKRPRNLRWIMFDAGHYPAIAAAWADGVALRPPPAEPSSLLSAAWLAGMGGRDA